MRFRHFLIIAALLLAAPLRGGDYSVLYRDIPLPLPEPSAPEIPATTVVLSDFGGCGDGVSSNTEAFRKAISALEKQGGGHLKVPAGVWLTGPISFKDRIDLHLERGAVILFSPDKAEFVRPDGKVTPAITASKRKDISITGEGIIDGNGEWWRAVKRGKVSDVEWKDYHRMGGTDTEDGSLWYPFNLKHYGNIASDYKAQERARTHLVRFTDCERVLVQGVTLQNSPKFHLVPQRCSQVIIDGVTVRCPWNAQNGDGIDLMFCKDVLVTRCSVDVGDDGICLKAGAGEGALRQGACERILICGNTVFHAHGGFVVGSEFSAGIRDIVVKDNTFCGTDTGLRFKSAPGRGGKTERIRICDIRMTDIRDEAIVFETAYMDVPVGEKGKMAATQQFLPEFCDISIESVVCRDARIAIRASGTLQTIHDVSISGSSIFYTESEGTIDNPEMITLRDTRLLSWEQL